MFKKFLFALAFALAFAFSSPMLVAAQSSKIGVVDTNSILQAMPETKTAETQLSNLSKRYEEEYAKLQQAFNTLYNEFEKMPATEPELIRQRKTQELAVLNQKIEEFQQSASQDLQKKQEELMAPIVAKVKIAIESVGKENGYGIIMDSSNLIYFSNYGEDLTSKVKQQLGL